jgi:hypothetical protein
MPRYLTNKQVRDLKTSLENSNGFAIYMVKTGFKVYPNMLKEG